MEVSIIGYSSKTQTPIKNGIFLQRKKKNLLKSDPFSEENDDYAEKQKKITVITQAKKYS